MILEFQKTNDNVKSPTRGNPSDAGLDVYAHLPKVVTGVPINPGSNTMVSTGLKFGIPHGYMLQVCNRSSMGAKKSLTVGAHVIDSGYEGEIFIDLHNIGNKRQTIKDGDKIAQLVLVPVVHFRPVEKTDGNLYGENISISNRKDGALGSTDKKPKQSSTADLHQRDRVSPASFKNYVPNGF
jgi:dUTP pyrophosphatase